MTEPEHQHSSSMVGRTIAGRYTIRATIGSGGMGYVYRATQAPIEREVALKVLRADLAHQDGIAERFTREARAASRIQHPNAITIFEFGEDDGTFYLAMELLCGETLRQRMRREPPMDPDHALDVFEAMAGALGAAHRVGVVHRDLKPDNIFLARFDGIGEVVKVLDFGLAKLVDRTADSEGLLTDVNLRLGTPRYMAPEQALGLQPIDARCDVYALGLLLFEMLAGKAPYQGEDGMEVLAQRLRREAPKLSELALHHLYSREMDELLADMLQRDRDRRPQDANEVGQRLKEIRKGGRVYRSQESFPEPEVEITDQPASPPTQVAGRRSFPGLAGPASAGQVYSSAVPYVSGAARAQPRLQQSSPGPRQTDNSLALDDFDKPTVVITSRDDFTPSPSHVQTGEMTPIAQGQGTFGKPTVYPQGRMPYPQGASGKRPEARAPRAYPSHLSPRVIAGVLLVAVGAPLLALAIKWAQGNRVRSESVIHRTEGEVRGAPAARPAAAPAPVTPPLPLKPAEPKRAEPSRPATPERPRVCYIRVLSVPPGAQVEREGQVLGNTPYLDSMPYGSTPVRYRVSASGYEPFETTVTPDHRRTINAALRLKGAPAAEWPRTPAQVQPSGGTPLRSRKPPIAQPAAPW